MQYFILTTRMMNDRINRSVHLMKEIGVEPELVFGIEKDNLPKEIRDIVFCPSTNRRYEKIKAETTGGERIVTNRLVSGLTVGEDAVALSHLKCVRLVVEREEPAIIVEDDFRLWVEGNVRPDQVKSAWDTIPDDTDFECFSKWHIWNPALEEHPENYEFAHKRVVLPTFGNQCYYLGVNFAKIFLNHILPIRVAADVIWRYPPKEYEDKLIYRHFYRTNDEDGLIWHHDDSSIKD